MQAMNTEVVSELIKAIKDNNPDKVTLLSKSVDWQKDQNARKIKIVIVKCISCNTLECLKIIVSSINSVELLADNIYHFLRKANTDESDEITRYLLKMKNRLKQQTNINVFIDALKHAIIRDDLQSVELIASKIDWKLASSLYPTFLPLEFAIPHHDSSKNQKLFLLIIRCLMKYQSIGALKNALMTCISYDALPCLKVIIKHVLILDENSFSEILISLLSQAIKKKKYLIFYHLYQLADKIDINEIIHLSIKHNEIFIFNFIIEQIGERRIKYMVDKIGNNILHYALRCYKIKKNNVSVMKEIIALEPQLLKQANKEGTTPEMLAYEILFEATDQDIEFIKFFSSHKIIANLRNKDSDTILHKAIKHMDNNKPYTRVVEYLISEHQELMDLENREQLSPRQMLKYHTLTSEL